MSRPSRPRWLKGWSTMTSWRRPKPATSSTIPLRAAASLELWGSGLSPDIRWAGTIEAPALGPARAGPAPAPPRAGAGVVGVVGQRVVAGHQVGGDDRGAGAGAGDDHPVGVA